MSRKKIVYIGFGSLGMYFPWIRRDYCIEGSRCWGHTGVLDKEGQEGHVGGCTWAKLWWENRIGLSKMPEEKSWKTKSRCRERIAGPEEGIKCKLCKARGFSCLSTSLLWFQCLEQCTAIRHLKMGSNVNIHINLLTTDLFNKYVSIY